MIETLLACILVVLALNLLVNVAVWARGSGVWNHLTFAMRRVLRRN